MQSASKPIPELSCIPPRDNKQAMGAAPVAPSQAYQRQEPRTSCSSNHHWGLPSSVQAVSTAEVTPVLGQRAPRTVQLSAACKPRRRVAKLVPWTLLQPRCLVKLARIPLVLGHIRRPLSRRARVLPCRSGRSCRASPCSGRRQRLRRRRIAGQRKRFAHLILTSRYVVIDLRGPQLHHPLRLLATSSSSDHPLAPHVQEIVQATGVVPLVPGPSVPGEYIIHPLKQVGLGLLAVQDLRDLLEGVTLIHLGLLKNCLVHLVLPQSCKKRSPWHNKDVAYRLRPHRCWVALVNPNHHCCTEVAPLLEQTHFNSVVLQHHHPTVYNHHGIALLALSDHCLSR
mmetsp:Transcript_87022/g.198633  ORF Transcript_87022/g.198633 Transcript_87022/m.198633 type:complete len:340 (-) Transcript_87022:874-1893(-)